MQLSKDVSQHLTNKLLLWNATLLNCCGTCWKAMLRVLLPTLKHVLQQIKVAASWVNTDFWLHKITSLAAKQIVLAWAAQHLQILPAKSRTTLYSLQQLFASSNLICCKTGLNVGGKTFAFQLDFRQCCKTRSMSVCCPFYRRTYRLCRVNNVHLLNLLCRVFTICASHIIYQNLFLLSPGY